MIGVDHHRVGDALGQLTELLEVLVDGDGDDLEVRVPLGMDFLLQCLPPGQLIAATSPTGEGDQQSFLAAMIAQRGDPTAHKVGQGEVGGDKFVECPAASRPGRADRGQTRLGVDRDGAVEQIAEDGQIEADVGDEGATVRDEHTRVVLTKPLRLERPAELGELRLADRAERIEQCSVVGHAGTVVGPHAAAPVRSDRLRRWCGEDPEDGAAGRRNTEDREAEAIVAGGIGE